MTISNTNVKAQAAGNLVTTAFPFTFKTYAKADIQVTLTDTSAVDSVLVLNSDYTVALNADQDASPGGTVTYLTYKTTGLPLPVGAKLTILSNLADLQGTSLPNGSAFFGPTVTDMADTRTILSHQKQETLDRSLKFPTSDTVLTVTLPSATLRANGFMGFDSAGNLLVTNSASLATTIGASDFMTQLFSGDGATTSFTLNAAAGTIANLDVYISGVRQRPTTDYTYIGGSSVNLSFVTAPAVGTNNIFCKWGTITATQTPSAGSVSTSALIDGSVTPAKLSTGAPTWPASGPQELLVGTSTPLGTASYNGITLNGTAGGYSEYRTAGTQRGLIFTDAAAMTVRATTGALLFHAASAEAGRFDANARELLIGTTTALGVANTNGVRMNGSSASFLDMLVGGSRIATIQATTDLNIGTANSTAHTVFQLNGVEIARLPKTSNATKELLIGTTAAFNVATANGVVIDTTGAGSAFLQLKTNGSERAFVYSDSANTYFTTTAATGGYLTFQIKSSNISCRMETDGSTWFGPSDPGGADKVRINGALTINSATMIQTKTAFTNGAAAAAGTLLNAPAAGNPTKWIPINDNGTTRYIPAW